MSTPLAFLDTETTGLDPDQHEVWEVGLILRDSEGIEVERVWQLPVDLGKADAMALKIGRWYDRRWPWPFYETGYLPEPDDIKRIDGAVQATEKYVVPRDRMADWAALFAELTDGAHLVGAVISFDEERLRRLLRRHHACPTWHYHLIDVEALAAGWLLGRYGRGRETANGTIAMPPWNSEELSRAAGVDPEDFDRHTALGDARWAMAIYDVVMGQPYSPGTATTDRRPEDR